jgi:flagellar basal-body rod modification protein FlgD
MRSDAVLATNSIATVNAEGTPRSVPTGPAAADTAQLGQDQFLTLMLAQLKNQDPLKPLEPAEFLGQLAQFSTVTGVQDVNRSVGQLAASLRSSQVIEGASLVGRSVLTSGTEARLSAGEPVRGSVDVPDGASAVVVTVHDASGALVRRLPLATRPGMSDFQWDGTTDRGTAAAPGLYRIEAVGRLGDRAESLDTLLQKRVDSVTIDPQGRGLTLNTPSGTVPIGDVRRVM